MLFISKIDKSRNSIVYVTDTEDNSEQPINIQELINFAKKTGTRILGLETEFSIDKSYMIITLNKNQAEMYTKFLALIGQFLSSYGKKYEIKSDIDNKCPNKCTLSFKSSATNETQTARIDYTYSFNISYNGIINFRQIRNVITTSQNSARSSSKYYIELRSNNVSQITSSESIHIVNSIEEFLDTISKIH